MKFRWIDRIVELSRGERIVAVKAVTLGEEYLADHFPTFPVLPGVLMLEALTEAGAWLVRDAHDFVDTVVLLREARNVTFKSFVKPGNLLRLEVDCCRLAQGESDFVGVGYCDQVGVVRAGFSLVHFGPERHHRSSERTADRLAGDARARFERLRY
ncbi:MAG: 3-hydroxyacyl-ACP dehydratase FabZ family protein [Phycisphaerae bacterium]